MKFCALWMPTEYHREIICLNKNSIHENISDIESKKNLVEINLLDNQDIHIYSKTFKKELTLHFLEKSSNGIFLYEFEDIILCKEINKYFIGDEFPVALYHCIKSFYHIHEHHSDSVDAITKAYIFPDNNKPNIKDFDNKALIHYLENYEKKFSTYRTYISRAYNRIEEIKKKKKYKYSVYTNYYPNILRLLSRAKGEEIYYNSLNNSKYNSSCRLGSNSNYSKIAFNIHNSLKKIKYIEKKMLDDFGFYHNKVSFNAAIMFFIVGVILTIVSFIR